MTRPTPSPARMSGEPPMTVPREPRTPLCEREDCRWQIVGPHYPHGSDDFSEPVHSAPEPEPRTPEEALAAALYYHDPLLTIDPRRTDSMTRARALLAALEAQGWRLVSGDLIEAARSFFKTADPRPLRDALEGVSEPRPDTGERRLREATEGALLRLVKASRAVDAMWDDPDPGTDDARDGLIWMTDDERAMAEVLRALRAVLRSPDLWALGAEPPADGDRPDYEAMRMSRGWPTPNHMRRVADALDILTPAKYGDVLRFLADLCDAALGADSEPPDDHKPGDPHHYRIECDVCGQRGMVNLTIVPQTTEPAIEGGAIRPGGGE